MGTLIDSFYKIGGVGKVAYEETEVEFGVDITLPSEGQPSYTITIEHSINHVFLNGIKMKNGIDNDFTINIVTNSVVFSSNWTIHNNDQLLITT